MNNTTIRVLMIDNFDSFTYNVVDELYQRSCEVRTYRNTISEEYLHEVIHSFNPHLIVISPGPGHPHETGISVPLVQKYHRSIPILGICLGHQVIVVALGGKVCHAPKVMHGRSSLIYHSSTGIFGNLPNPLTAGRYHSLCATTLPADLITTAHTKDKVIMAVQGKDKKNILVGLQFHPESIMTTLGGKLIDNIIEMVIAKKSSI